MNLRYQRLIGVGSVLSTAVLSIVAVSAAHAQSSTTLPEVTVTGPERAAAQPRRSTPRADIARAPRAAVNAPHSPVQPPTDNAAADRGEVSASVAALPAATTVLDASAIARAPIAHSIDLFRSLPGFNVASLGQGGVASGISLRGYVDTEHGRDIAYFIDGVPLNEVSSLHTPNYADLNVLMPETVKSIEVVRGPFSVEYGDSNLGGSINIVTKEAEPFASLGLSGGAQGTVRGIGTYATTQGGWLPFLALETYRTDGYRENSFVDRYNSFNKITTRLPDGAAVSFRAQAYGTRFGAPSYISRDAVEAGALSDRAAVNRTDGGHKQLENFVASYSSGPTDQELNAALFVNHDRTTRFTDFGGGQRMQSGERTMGGGRISKIWTGAIADAVPVQFLLGGNWRSDALDTFQGPTLARQPSGARAVDAAVHQHNLAVFAQMQVKPLQWLKLTGGGRFDQFFYDIDDRISPGVIPNISLSVTSPKAGVAITPTRWLELFANYGEGFRSPDATLELLGNPGIRPFRIASSEGGVQLRFDRFRIMASYWTTDSQNESFQPAPGLPVTFLGQARRDGVDVDGRVFLRNDAESQIALFANYSGMRARLIDAAPSSVVPNVPDYVANLGVDVSVATLQAQRLSGAAYVTFVGRKPLTQDGLISTRPFSRVTAKLAYSWPDGWTAFTQGTWYPGDRLSETALNFGDPTGASSADIFTSAQPRLVALAGLSYRFSTGATRIAGSNK